MFSGPPTPPNSNNAQQGQMIQLCPISTYSVTQRNLEKNPQINLSPSNAVQFNQQHQAKSRLTKEKNYFQLLFASLIILFHIKNYIIFVVKQENFHN